MPTLSSFPAGPDAPAPPLAPPGHAPAPRLRVAFLIDRLNRAGAARQLVELATALHGAGHAVVVFVFYDGTPLESELRAAGVRVRSLGKRSRWDIGGFYTRLARAARRERPDVLHGYLGVPNLVALSLKPLLPSTKIVWGIRASDTRQEWYGWIPRLLDSLASALSASPDLIIANSFAGGTSAVSRGYPPKRVVVIPNGIDARRFVPSREARARFRRRLRIEEARPLVGIVGRLDPMKDHSTFLLAARIVAARHDARFVVVGDGPDGYRRGLQAMACRLGLDERVTWLPGQAEMTDVYNGLDVLCSSSRSCEGFPNVVAEAMACGVPCVVTDVGDSARVAGRFGQVVPARDARALAAAVCRMLETAAAQRARLAAERRAWIEQEFSRERLLRRSERALTSLVPGRVP